MSYHSNLSLDTKDRRAEQALTGADEREYARQDKRLAEEEAAEALAAWGNQTGEETGELAELSEDEAGDTLAVFGMDAEPSSDKPPGQDGDAPQDDDAAKRRAHEEAEAKRKAEWEAKQAARRAADQAQMDRLDAMSPEEIAAESAARISADTERLTRRNMKDCVSEHIQAMCREDPGFARQVLRPRKSMVHCFWYINRKAREFLQREMKDNDVKPENGVYGGDVPDGLCYQWAVEYFNDPDAQEDQEKDEKFVPRPYYGGKTKAKKAQEKKPPKPPKSKPTMEGQLSLLGEAG